MSSPVEQIKQRLSIVDVVGSYIKLQKAGQNFKAKCPFHNEKTPSFMISPTRNTFHCFGCGEGGDIFTFVERFEGLDFKGALYVLAERAGVALTSYRPEERDAKDRLRSLMEDATRLCETELTKTPKAMQYLVERGLSNEVITTWRLGYTKPGWRNLYEQLTELGYSRKECEDAGFIKKSEKGNEYYDRFRGRIMFPINDSAGRVIAFSARILPDSGNPEYRDETAKYINSPDTPLYNKSHALFGFDKAKLAIRKLNFAIVVEGQLDVIGSHQAGYANTVAVSGSAMTETQLNLLNRLSPNIVLAFDADQAGVSSSGRTAALALSMGMNVKVATFPPGVDPADIAKESPFEWKRIVRNSTHIVEFFLKYLLQTVHDRRTLRLEVGKRVLPYVARIPNKIDQAHFISLIAGRLGLGEEPVWEELRKISADPQYAHRREVHHSDEAAHSDAFDNLTERRLIGILLSQKRSDGRDLDVGVLEQQLQELFGDAKLERLVALGEQAQELMFEVESIYEDAHTLQQDVDEMLRAVRRNRVIGERDRVLGELRKAEHTKDKKRIDELSSRHAALTKELEDLAV